MGSKENAIASALGSILSWTIVLGLVLLFGIRVDAWLVLLWLLFGTAVSNYRKDER